MANWAKGLASGLETGYRLGEVMQRGAERNALREAAQATPEVSQGYTAEQGAQLEEAAKSGLYDIGIKTDEAGNFQGYTVTPKASPEMQGLMAPGQVSDIYGQRYAGTLAPEQLQGIRMGRMADIVAETDPIRAAQLRAQQSEQEFQAKYRPMQLESMGLKVEGERADAADRKRMTDFQAWMQEDPSRAQNFQAVAAKARELGMSMDQQFKIASNLTGIDEAEFKASQSRIRKLIANQGLDGLLKAHRESDDLDPGSHFEATRGKDGRITLNRVDTASGQVIQPNVFSGKEAEVVGYLNKAAMDPATIVDYTMNLEKNRAAIEASQASAESHRAYAAKLRSAGDEAKGLEKKVSDAEKLLGRKLTDDEKKILVGLTPRPREVSNSDAITLSKELVGKPTGRLVDGKQERYTQETAITAARQMLEQAPTTTGMPGWGERPAAPAPAAPAAPAQGVATQTPPRAAVDPLSLQIDRETEEMLTGRRTAYSPEVQAVMDARSGARRQAEQSYLQREQALATGRGLWR